MFAPLRFPPCFRTSVVMSKTFMKLTGPDATPFVVFTMSPFGRSDEKLNPVPPPLWWTIAVYLTALKMSGRLSSIGRTKHALSWPRGAPAFISVGVLGKNSRFAIMS